MRTIPDFDPPSRLRRWGRRCLCCLAVALAGAGGVATADAPWSRPAAISYRAIQLDADRYTLARINARGQVAFNATRDGRSRAVFYNGSRFINFGTLGGSSAAVAALNDRGQIVFNVVRNGRNRTLFYDGRSVADIGTLGGPEARAAGLNELGQIAGTSSTSSTNAVVHPYRWSRASGMVDLGTIGIGDVVVHGINKRGQVYGRATFPHPGLSQTHGFFWSPRAGLVDIGVIGEVSFPTAMNDAGTIVGYAGRGPQNVLAFRWTRATGIGDLGSLPHEFTWATDINRAGQIVGATPFVPGGWPHPFLWTPGRGLLDLGVGTAERGAGTEVNEQGMVIGYLFRNFILSHGFIWTRETGLIEIGAGNATLSTAAFDVNNRGQVVGAIGQRAFVWTRNQGFLDLNTLVSGAPAGLVLDGATAISENGVILATASTGLYLLVPRDALPRPGMEP